MSWLSRWYSPESYSSRMPNTLSSVDLPEPDEPMMLTNSPASMPSEMSLRTCKLLSPIL